MLILLPNIATVIPINIFTMILRIPLFQFFCHSWIWTKYICNKFSFHTKAHICLGGWQVQPILYTYKWRPPLLPHIKRSIELVRVLRKVWPSCT
jgi:hypothetical protein